jgi:YHS domain-containing protein
MGRWIVCGLTTVLTVASLVTGSNGADDDETGGPYAAFESMIGGWKGTAVPASNPRKGWQEKHMWSWKFSKGTPIGMTISIEGGKVFKKGDLTFDADKSVYQFVATDVADKPATYVGKFEGKAIVLLRSEATPEGKERITIRPNGVRYTMIVDHKADGSPQFKKTIDAGFTKEGESFAAGGGASDLPKCIITGGSAAMTVTFNGKTFPICCTGCRDEFNDNPEKYVARAAAKAAGEPVKTTTTSSKPAPATAGESEMADLVDSSKSKATAKTKAKSATKTKEAMTEKSASKTATKGSPEDRANRDLNQGRAFERGGRIPQALIYYKDIVKKYPETEAAKKAAERIKALAKD